MFELALLRKLFLRLKGHTARPVLNKGSFRTGENKKEQAARSGHPSTEETQ
jgi:hypothetical protein